MSKSSSLPPRDSALTYFGGPRSPLTLGKDEKGGWGGGRRQGRDTAGAERGDQTPRQLRFTQDKSLVWIELTRLTGHCIYRMEQKLAITFPLCGLHIAGLYKLAHIKAEHFSGLFPGSGVLISS